MTNGDVSEKMAFKFIVIGVSTLPSKLISVTLKSMSIPGDVPKKAPDVFSMDVGGAMKEAMEIAVKQQQKMLGVSTDAPETKIVMTPDEFDNCRLTVGDEVTISITKEEER